MKFKKRVLSTLAGLLIFVVPLLLCSACGGVTTTENTTTTFREEPVATTTTKEGAQMTQAPQTSTKTTTTAVSMTTTTTTTTATTTSTEPTGASWYADAAWNRDGALKILAIGNSFSEDSMKFVFNIAFAAGVQDVYLGNLFIGGCSVKTHLENAQADSASYTYYTNRYGTWKKTDSYKLSDAVKSENWDFISFQQASTFSGRAHTYDDLEALMDAVKPLCTNPDVEFAWHMTWAYKNGYESNPYGGQDEMYNAIVSAVQNKIVPNKSITKIIPNGTAIQNARTSYLGDSFTRDNSHLTLDTGRTIAALTTVEALIGIDWTTFDMESLYFLAPNAGKGFPRLAVESTRNAIQKPFEVTQSAF